MPDDQIQSFLAAGPAERMRLVLEDQETGKLRAYFGDSAYAEYRAIAEITLPRLNESHLAATAPPNLIFLPGVMGSLLDSKTLGGVWWIDLRNLGRLNDLKLAPDGHEDRDPNYRVFAFSTDSTYAPFLASVLRREDFGHELFPFDWRKPLARSATSLRDKILDVHTRNGGLPVHLVAHSMGGLTLRATLMEYGADLWSKLGRIVFIGTPHYGSPAIAGYLKNHLWGFELLAVLAHFLSRETFRSLWGVISMLPAPKGVYPGTRENDPSPWRPEELQGPYQHPCANFDMYQAEAWKLDLEGGDLGRLQAVLNGGAAFHRQMREAHDTLDQELRDRMLVIAGVGYKTLFRLAYKKGFLGLWERMDKVTSRKSGDPHREGDGRVPLASAELENVGEIRYVKGVHGGLSNIPEVYEEVFRWLNEEELELPRTPVEALSQHLAGAAASSETPNLDGTGRADPASGDPGYWQLEPPPPERLQELQEELERGRLPELLSVKLL